MFLPPLSRIGISDPAISNMCGKAVEVMQFGDNIFDVIREIDHRIQPAIDRYNSQRGRFSWVPELNFLFGKKTKPIHELPGITIADQRLDDDDSARYGVIELGYIDYKWG